MSQMYSTGELAKLAGISVRTVQYYDQRGILPPTELSEGGRRLYSEKDRERLEVIIFLREMDFSIQQIKSVLAEENAHQVLNLLLEDQIHQLESDLQSQKEKLDQAKHLKKSLSQQNNSSLEALRDVSIVMKNQQSWRRLWLRSISGVVLIATIYVGLILLAGYVFHLKWIAFGAIPVFFLALNGWLHHYFQNIEYLCPNCHKTFRPGYNQFVLAGHTPRTRKLTCPHCHKRSYCLEMAREK